MILISCGSALFRSFINRKFSTGSISSIVAISPRAVTPSDKGAEISSLGKGLNPSVN